MSLVLAQKRYDDVVGALPSLQSWWRFDEASGAPQDAKGVVAGTIAGALLQNEAGLLVGQRGGKSIKSSGSNQYVNFGDVYDFAGTAPMTVVAWVKPDTLAASTCGIVAKTNAAVDGWLLRHTTAGLPQFLRYASSVFVVTASTVALVNGAVAMLAATYDGATQSIYHFSGGKLVSSVSAASAGSITNHAGELRVASRSDATAGLKGWLDDVQIHNAALSRTTLMRIYRLGSRRRELAVLGGA